MPILTSTAPTTATELSLTRLHLMRAGYRLMAVGWSQRTRLTLRMAPAPNTAQAPATAYSTL